MKNYRYLMISNSDKGGVTIISAKKDYYDKIKTLLEKDPTQTMEGKVNHFLDNLYQTKHISDSVKKSMKT